MFPHYRSIFFFPADYQGFFYSKSKIIEIAVTKNISGIVATILSENNAEKCITFVMHVNDKLKINYYLMGLGRLELPTLRLSGTHSNQLSYKPWK